MTPQNPPENTRTRRIHVSGWYLFGLGCAIWLVVWQASTVTVSTSGAWRVTIVLLGPVLAIIGLTGLISTSDAAVRPWLGAGALVTTLVVVLAVAYTNSVVTVYPTATTLNPTDVLPLVARPITLNERLTGSRSISWSSSDSLVARVILGKRADGTDTVAVRAMKPGRATIYAVRGVALAQTRISVRDPLTRRVPPVCAQVSDTLQGVRCLSGAIISPNGQPLPRVDVLLRAFFANGQQAWVLPAHTDDVDGRYEFNVPRAPSDTTRDSLTYRLVIGNQVVENRHVWFIPTQWGLDSTSRDISSVLLRRDVNQDIDVTLNYSPQSSFFILLLLLPAIVGLLGTVAFRHWYGEIHEGQLTQPSGQRRAAIEQKRRRYLLFVYVFGNALVWGITLGIYAWSYAFRKIETISVFSAGLTIPVLAPTFAFLGVLVYATYVLSRRRRRPNDSDYSQHQLLAIGNRIVVAPYVAVIAVLLINPSNPTNRQIPFLCFFTGLWIEPVLRLIKAVGDRLTISSSGLISRLPGDTEAEEKPTAGAPDRSANPPTEELQKKLPTRFREPVNDTQRLLDRLPQEFEEPADTERLQEKLPAEPPAFAGR